MSQSNNSGHRFLVAILLASLLIFSVGANIFPISPSSLANATPSTNSTSSDKSEPFKDNNSTATIEDSIQPNVTNSTSEESGDNSTSEESGDNSTATTDQVIQPPVADAGYDKTVNEGDIVMLDGSASYGFDKELELEYFWNQTRNWSNESMDIMPLVHSANVP